MPGYMPKPPVCILNRAHPQARGLVAAWPFDVGGGGKNVRDAVGSNDGTAQAYGKWIGGPFGWCMEFNGSSDHIASNAGAAMNFGSDGPFSMCLWFRTTTSVAYSPMIHRGRVPIVTGDLYQSLDFITNSPRIYKGVKGSAESLVLATGTYNDGKWHHAVGVDKDQGTYMGIYMNGALNNSSTVTQRNLGSQTPLYIGGRPDEGFDFDGHIDDVRIYNRALSASEIAAIYHDPWAMYRPSRTWLKAAFLGGWFLRNQIINRRMATL